MWAALNDCKVMCEKLCVSPGQRLLLLLYSPRVFRTKSSGKYSLNKPDLDLKLALKGPSIWWKCEVDSEIPQNDNKVPMKVKEGDLVVASLRDMLLNVR